MSMPMEQMGQSCMFELAQTVWRMIRQICGSGVPARVASCWIQSRIASRESMVGAYGVSLATIVVLSLGAGGGGSIVVVLRHAIKLSDAIRQKVIMIMESRVCQQRPSALLKRRSKAFTPSLADDRLPENIHTVNECCPVLSVVSADLGFKVADQLDTDLDRKYTISC